MSELLAGYQPEAIGRKERVSSGVYLVTTSHKIGPRYTGLSHHDASVLFVDPVPTVDDPKLDNSTWSIQPPDRNIPVSDKLRILIVRPSQVKGYPNTLGRPINPYDALRSYGNLRNHTYNLQDWFERRIKRGDIPDGINAVGLVDPIFTDWKMQVGTATKYNWTRHKVGETGDHTVSGAFVGGAIAGPVGAAVGMILGGSEAQYEVHSHEVKDAPVVKTVPSIGIVYQRLDGRYPPRSNFNIGFSTVGVLDVFPPREVLTGGDQFDRKISDDYLSELSDAQATAKPEMLQVLTIG